MSAGERAVTDPRGEATRASLGRIQRLIASRMSQSHETIPDFSMSVDVDVEALLVRRETLPAEGRPSLNDFVLKATALALRRHPKINSSYDDGGIDVYPHVNVGVAVAAGDALVVATVFDADALSVFDIARRTRRLGDDARRGTLSMFDIEGATFTVSNLGMFGVDRIVPIITPGQVGILGVGAATPRVVPAVDGTVSVHRVLTLTFSGDHRVLNGTDAAAFLTAVRALLEAADGVVAELEA